MPIWWRRQLCKQKTTDQCKDTPTQLESQGGLPGGSDILEEMGPDEELARVRAGTGLRGSGREGGAEGHAGQEMPWPVRKVEAGGHYGGINGEAQGWGGVHGRVHHMQGCEARTLSPGTEEAQEGWK